MLPLAQALELASQSELDLVEVASNADPPVCRILDYGKFRYMQAKKDRETRKSQKLNLVRQVRFRTRIGDHDIAAKERKVRKLLDEGAKVKISVLFRGREISHPELGVNLLKRITEQLQDQAKLEQAPSMEGRMLSIVLAPATDSKAAKRDKQGKETDNAQDENP